MQTVLECRQCGASLDIDEGRKIVYCQYCGSANAISYADRFGLYNRANHLRRLNEFDRAIGVYEDILNGDPHDAEAHFGIALCKYGIEYVDDPETGRKVPTCHRTRYTLMSQDTDFKKAVEDADADTARIYRQEAAQIDAILKRIRQLSADQEKYDIFICYKEGDGLGGRTHTSVLAQKLYQKLENSGYKVFFARKTLEKKLGSEYEPIIFSALFSAKVMLAVGSKPEEFQGVWVRNEWMRFRERMEAGEECTLIPLYREMSPEELPQEFVSLQALDMGKIGFEQDLLDGLAKLIHKNNFAQGEGYGQAADSTALRRRAYLFLEQGDFKNASAYFERTLDADPEDAEAYFGKLLLELGCRQESDLQNMLIGISGRENYQLAVRFAKGALLERYQSYASVIDARLAEIREKAEIQRRERLEQMEAQQKVIREQQERRRTLERKKRRARLRICIAVAVIIGIVILILGVIRIRAGTFYDVLPMYTSRKSDIDTFAGFGYAKEEYNDCIFAYDADYRYSRDLYYENHKDDSDYFAHCYSEDNIDVLVMIGYWDDARTAYFWYSSEDRHFMIEGCDENGLEYLSGIRDRACVSARDAMTVYQY